MVLQPPPDDSLKAVFTPDVLRRWSTTRKPSEHLRDRLNAIAAHGPWPSEPSAARRLRLLLARKAAWDTYLRAAFACGMFEGPKGNDLRARLTGISDSNFRSAMAECLSCWFLAACAGFTIFPEAPGRQNKTLEMRAVRNEQQINVEVKAPFCERPERVWCGDDSDKIAQALASANRQFDDSGQNLLAIVPSLRTPVYGHREPLVRAAYGETKIVLRLNRATGEPSPPDIRFFPEGRFLRTTTPTGKSIKPSGLPAMTRISGVVCIEEQIGETYPFPGWGLALSENAESDTQRVLTKAVDRHLGTENDMWVAHHALVLHNPYACNPLDLDIFADYPQFIPRDNIMTWTDGYETRV